MSSTLHLDAGPLGVPVPPTSGAVAGAGAAFCTANGWCCTRGSKPGGACNACFGGGTATGGGGFVGGVVAAAPPMAPCGGGFKLFPNHSLQDGLRLYVLTMSASGLLPSTLSPMPSDSTTLGIGGKLQHPGLNILDPTEGL